MKFDDLHSICISEAPVDGSPTYRSINLFPEDIEDLIKFILARCGVYETFVPYEFNIKFEGGEII